MDTLINGDQLEKIEFSFLILDNEDKQDLNVADLELALN